MDGPDAGGIALDSEALALEVMHQVGPGGEYLTEQHTMRHFREMWMPTLFNRKRIEEWLADSNRALGTRLRDKTVAMIESHEPEPLADHVRAEIRGILAQG